MLVRLDPRSDKSIYLQIADAVAAEIEAGSLQPGDRLPSARSLGESLDVNMHTVLHAYSELESWGLVEMRRGRGGVVVAHTARLEAMTAQLVAEAKRRSVPKTEVAALLEEAWK